MLRSEESWRILSQVNIVFVQIAKSIYLNRLTYTHVWNNLCKYNNQCWDLEGRIEFFLRSLAHIKIVFAQIAKYICLIYEMYLWNDMCRYNNQCRDLEGHIEFFLNSLAHIKIDEYLLLTDWPMHLNKGYFRFRKYVTCKLLG